MEKQKLKEIITTKLSKEEIELLKNYLKKEEQSLILSSMQGHISELDLSFLDDGVE